MTIIRVYQTRDRESPFADWLAALPSEQSLRVDEALIRMELGNFGDHKSVGGGVIERRIFSSPALRVYYAMDGKELVILLAGGTKQNQDRDIERAKSYWADYRSRKDK